MTITAQLASVSGRQYCTGRGDPYGKKRGRYRLANMPRERQIVTAIKCWQKNGVVMIQLLCRSFILFISLFGSGCDLSPRV